MTFTHKLLLVVVFAIASLADARDAPSLLPLEFRLASSKITECWGALTKLRLCSNEIVLFFLNEESYLTLGCCRAIHLITHNCWPAMLALVGFTIEEVDILWGYCDAEIVAPLVVGPVN